MTESVSDHLIPMGSEGFPLVGISLFFILLGIEMSDLSTLS